MKHVTQSNSSLVCYYFAKYSDYCSAGFLQFMKRILNQILIPMKFELSFLKQNKTEQNKTKPVVLSLCLNSTLARIFETLTACDRYH